MAIILKNIRQNHYRNLSLPSYSIIGIMGNGYLDFLESIHGKIFKNDCFSQLIVKEELMKYYHGNNLYDDIQAILQFFSLDVSFLNQKIKYLSNSMQKILMYLVISLIDSSIIIIEEPLLDLDFFYQKKVMSFLHQLTKNKTIIIGSNNSDTIYKLSKNVLLIDHDKCDYGDTVNIMSNMTLLQKYDLDLPQIVSFIKMAKKKNVSINYSFDIRDLIKDVYKNVS